ncbi:MAG: dihydrofolate reductase [Patescibacteria group bacterium]
MQTPTAPIVIVAAMAKGSRAIGKDNRLLWHIPEDLKRFKQLTLGHPIIMGRKTFESIISILGKPLPGRTNIILTRDQSFSFPGTQTANTLESAFALASHEEPDEIHIGGGAELYKQSLPYVERIHLTVVDDDVKGDTFFPEFEESFQLNRKHLIQTYNNVTYQWLDFVRK